MKSDKFTKSPRRSNRKREKTSRNQAEAKSSQTRMKPNPNRSQNPAEIKPKSTQILREASQTQAKAKPKPAGASPGSWSPGTSGLDRLGRGACAAVDRPCGPVQTRPLWPPPVRGPDRGLPVGQERGIKTMDLSEV